MWKRAAFRFAFLYWLLYMLPAPGAVSLVDLLPWKTDKLDRIIGWPMERLAAWVAAFVFHLPASSANWHPTGSGDTALNYIECLCMALLALLGCAVWTAVAETRKRRTEYQTLYAWLQLLLRFTLGLTLLNYGIFKVFPGQFQPPTLYALRGTFGDATPMHLLWTFMGASVPYTRFGGWMEVIPGVLLLFGRTSTLGALAAVPVLTNVVMLNLCYDVPVKLYSSHLLAMALFLLLPDALPIFRFLFLRREAALTGMWVPRPQRRALRIASRVVQVTALFLALVWFPLAIYRIMQPNWEPVALQGSWTVEQSTGWPAQLQWKEVVLDAPKHWMGVFADGHDSWLDAEFDNHAQSVTLPKEQTVLHWTKGQDGKVAMDGTCAGKPVSLRMKARTFALQTRGFHWVQEYPANTGRPPESP